MDEPLAQEVREILGDGVTLQIAKRSELRYPQALGSERSIAWLEKRRPWKNREHHLNASRQFIHLVFLPLLFRRT